MADQAGLQGAPLVLSPADDPGTTPVHPPTDSFGPGSVDSGPAGSGDKVGVGNPPVSGTGDRGGPDPLAQP